MNKKKTEMESFVNYKLLKIIIIIEKYKLY